MLGLPSLLQANEAIEHKVAEIADCEATLLKIRDERAKLNERVRALNAHEAEIQAKLLNLTQERRQIISIDVKSKVSAIKSTVSEKAERMRQLQNQIEVLSQEHESSLQELAAVERKGVLDGQAAGVRQSSINVANER